MRSIITLSLLLLAIPAGLLLAPLLASTTTTAAAPVDATTTAPRIIGLTVHGEPTGSGSTLYRLWNDGLIEHNRRICAGCQWIGWLSVPEN